MKPRTDEERRTWLQLSKLKSERDKLEHERDQLRGQLRAALVSGEYWTGPPAKELDAHLKAAIKQWNATVEEIRQIHDAGRPPSTLPPSPRSLIIGGRQEIGVPVMRVR